MPPYRPPRTRVHPRKKTTPNFDSTDSDHSDSSPNSDLPVASNIKQRLRNRQVSAHDSQETLDVPQTTARPASRVNPSRHIASVSATAPSLKGKDNIHDISHLPATQSKPLVEAVKPNYRSTKSNDTQAPISEKRSYLLSDILQTLPSKEDKSRVSEDSDSPVPIKRQRRTPRVTVGKRTCPATDPKCIQSSSELDMAVQTKPNRAVQASSTPALSVAKGRTRQEARAIIRQQEHKLSHNVQILDACVPATATSSRGETTAPAVHVGRDPHISQEVIDLCISSDEADFHDISISDDDDDADWEPEVVSSGRYRNKSSGAQQTRLNTAKKVTSVLCGPNSVKIATTAAAASHSRSDQSGSGEGTNWPNLQEVVAEVHHQEISVERSVHSIQHSPGPRSNPVNHSSIVDDSPMLSNHAKDASDLIIYRNGKPVAINPNANLEPLDGRFKRLWDQKRPMMRTLAALTDISHFYYVMKDGKGRISKENDSVAQFIIDIGIIVKDAGKELIYQGRAMQHDISKMRADAELQIKQELPEPTSTKKPLSSSQGREPRTAEETLRRRNVCQLCGQSYVKKADLDTHLNRHADLQIVCTDCGKGFYSADSHRQHKLSHLHGFLSCEFCERKFETLKGLRAHVKRHGAQDFVCTLPKCGKTFKDKYTFVDHLKTGHNNERSVPCNLCTRFYKSKHVMQSHRNRDHKKIRNVKSVK